MPGIWLSPHVERAERGARRSSTKLDLRPTPIALVGKVDELGISEAEIVARGWDLASLAGHYAEVLAAVTRLDPAPARRLSTPSCG